MPNGVLNNRNGLFLKVIIGVLTAGLVSAGGGMVKLFRDVGVLQSELNKRSEIERRVENVEKLTANIATDRDKRTEIIQQFRDEFAEIKGRLNALERHR